MKQILMMTGLFAAFAVSVVEAQSFFVDGTVFASIERRARADSSIVAPPPAGVDGTVAGGGVTIGAWLTPHVTVRLEMAFPARLDAVEEQSFSDIIPVSTSSSGGVITVPLSYVQRTEISERTRAFSALLAYHTDRRGRVQVSYLGGSAFLSGTRHLKYSSTYPSIPLSTLPGVVLRSYTSPTFETSVTYYAVSVEVGADADVRITSRLSLVPHIRVVGFSHGVSLRPGVSLRLHW